MDLKKKYIKNAKRLNWWRDQTVPWINYIEAQIKTKKYTSFWSMKNLAKCIYTIDWIWENENIHEIMVNGSSICYSQWTPSVDRLRNDEWKRKLQ